MTPLLVFFATIIVLLYAQYYLSRRHLYAAAAKIKGPRGLPLIGNAHLFVGKTADFFQKLNSIFSHVDKEPYKLWLGPYLLISLKNPVHLEKIMSSSKFAQKHELYVFLESFVGEGLISSSGAKTKYKIHRRLIQPLFDLKFVASTIHIIQNQTNICMKILEDYVDKKSFNIHNVIINCSIDIMGEITLGQNINSQKYGPTKFCQALIDMYDLAYARMTKVWLQPDFIYNRLSLKTKSDAVHADLKDFIQEALIDSWKRRKITKTEVTEQFVPTIDRLLEVVENNQDIMNNEDLVHHLITLFAASDDTFAIIASFTAVCFGMYHEYQKKAAEEIRTIIGKEPKPITMEDIYKLKYLDMCIKDIMRLFTIAPYILRRNSEDFQLDKWTLPRGAAIVIPIHHLHRDPTHWENPDHFHPNHFLPEAVQKRHIYAYLPFSSGPRGCIGKMMANVLLKVFLVQLLQKFEIQAEGKVPDITLCCDISVRPREGYICTLKKRNWNTIE
ncbi:unnamed protein product [Phaedon cochleariae]|uniref:Cytochrome P450 n=1 Tax=Phaedon cochleariae TaxID=80249 RepID=A0A9P0DT25_PHACE|nr:unnamed protein product [Phaedon cochleariae]